MEQAGASTYHSASLPGFTETASAKPGNNNALPWARRSRQSQGGIRVEALAFQFPRFGTVLKHH